jgi:DNA mismatch endonuclease (patch repair protein)
VIPAASSEAVRNRMRSTPRKNTRPEIALRSQLHKLGLRFRVDVSPVRGHRGRADLVFKSPKLVVYVDGCFWHSCPIHGAVPKTNERWWGEKLERNKQRDLRTNREMRRMGWKVIRIWEHENPVTAANRIAKVIHRIQSSTESNA